MILDCSQYVLCKRSTAEVPLRKRHLDNKFGHATVQFKVVWCPISTNIAPNSSYIEDITWNYINDIIWDIPNDITWRLLMTSLGISTMTSSRIFPNDIIWDIFPINDNLYDTIPYWLQPSVRLWWSINLNQLLPVSLRWLFIFWECKILSHRTMISRLLEKIKFFHMNYFEFSTKFLKISTK